MSDDNLSSDQAIKHPIMTRGVIRTYRREWADRTSYGRFKLLPWALATLALGLVSLPIIDGCLYLVDRWESIKSKLPPTYKEEADV